MCTCTDTERMEARRRGENQEWEVKKLGREEAKKKEKTDWLL